MYDKSKSNSGNAKNGSKYRGRKNRGNSRSSNKGEEVKESRSACDTNVSSYVGRTNDPSWYKANERLINDAAKISFANQLGATMNMVSGKEDVTKSFIHNYRIAGVIGLEMVNTPGIATSSSDGVNLAAANLFQVMRRSLSTVATYSSADVMMYALGIDSIYSLYAYITRAFGILNAYSAVNLYMPEGLLLAGYNFNHAAVVDFRKNANIYRTRFNSLVFKASTLYLPTDFSVTSRHAWLYSNYFLDGASVKAQMYIHRMMGVHKIQEYESNQGTALEYIPFIGTVGNPLNMIYLMDVFETLIDVYRSSDSMLKIAADMRRAFEGKTSWTLAYVDEQYITLPTIDANVLNQIMNTSIYPKGMYNYLKTTTGAANLNLLSVTQDVDSNMIVFNPKYVFTTASGNTFGREWNFLLANKMINFYKDDVSIDDILEATRNTLGGYNVVGTTTTECCLYQTGVDLCVGMGIVILGSSDPVMYEIDANFMDIDSADVLVRMAYCHSTAFNYTPMITIALGTSEAARIHQYFTTNLENYSVVPNEVINNLNNNILCSMWNIPEFGAIKA